MVNCKACGRPFPMPMGDESIESLAQTHQCPYCGESAEYFESDAIEQA
jgi:DNA-directed RNA polymerase subunit RPC12/RpoP